MAKKTSDGKNKWFQLGEEGNTLENWCRRLEAAIPSSKNVEASKIRSWCVSENPTLADMSIYHLLSTASSLVTGSAVSFMDNEKERVEKAYSDLPRIIAIIKACRRLPSIQRWEESRPDTFS